MEDYCDWLADKALGWLGWTEEETLHSDMNAIEIAYKGRVGMLRVIFGENKTSESTPNPNNPPKDARGKPIVLTPAAFDMLFSGKRPKQIKHKTKQYD